MVKLSDNCTTGCCHHSCLRCPIGGDHGQ